VKLPFAVVMLLRERGRYVPAVFAIGFSALLLTMQCGLLLGFMAGTSRPIDRAAADVWVASPDALALGYSHPIPEAWLGRVASHPGVERVAPYLYGFTLWHKPDGGLEQCYLIGTRLDEGEVGVIGDMTPELRRLLTRPGAVAVYGPDRPRLGLERGAGEAGEVTGQRVRLAGIVSESGGVGMMPGVFASLRTARLLLPEVAPHETTYLLARCRNPDDRAEVARQLRERYPDMSVLTREEFASLTQTYWLVKTNAGVILLFIAGLGLVVGGVITGQTLYAATVAARREFAVLRAMGIPRRRIGRLVMAQSFGVAIAGVAIAHPVCLGIAQMAQTRGIDAKLPGWMLASTAAFVVGIAIAAGMFALRSLRLAEPEVLLR
jgi:putative ABC transport system permease protein